jgi:NAD(P)-dependent dehydrogenase (short-subunit alcohol dehydrogenase family)
MTTMGSDRAGSVVIVTGAGSGIGRATAAAFAAAGAHVLGVGRRQDALERTRSLNPRIEMFVADVTADEAPEAIVADARRRWDRVDVVVNNAGAFSRMPLVESDRKRIEAVFATNVLAPSLLTAAAVPMLRASHGVVINISSTYGHRPAPGSSHYGASKAALEHLTRSWALELAVDRIRVNAVAPGPTETEVLETSGLSAEAIAAAKAQHVAQIPLGRRGEATDVARWVLALADPASSWVTGQVLTVDGGLELT